MNKLDKQILSVDISVLIQEYNKLQKAYETLKNNLKYEQQLRMNVERELLLLQEEIDTKYKRKKSSAEKELEAKERAERKLRGTTKDGRPLAKAAEWIESYDQFEAIRKWLFEESAKNPIKRARNRYAWSLGCAIGIRCGDLVKLKWGHLIDNDGNFKENMRKHLTNEEIEDCFNQEKYLNNIETIFARFS